MNMFLLFLVGYLFAGTFSYWILHKAALTLFPDGDNSHHDGLFMFVTFLWPLAFPAFLGVIVKESEEFSLAESVTEFYNNIFNP